MTPYEAAMKRLELESMMAFALCDMWELAEIGDFEGAMHWQFVYLMARDESFTTSSFESAHQYYNMAYIAKYGSIE